MAEGSLKHKTLTGVGWTAADSFLRYGVSFVVSIILARLLSPDDYGLIGLTAVFTAICTELINGGFKDALIRKKNTTDDDYNTVLIVNILMSILIYVVIFISAPFIATFFEREELILLIQVSSLSMLIGALSVVQLARYTKRLDFKSQTKINFIASFGSAIIGISMALSGFGVWSLVGQTLSSQAISTTLLWIYGKWIPTFRFNTSSFRELFGFGWKMMVSGFLNTVWNELYQVVVGKFYSPATLGQYSRAKGFSQLLSSNLTFVVQRVTFPVLSNIQDEKERMALVYRRIIKITMFLTTIAMFLLGAISEPLIYCLIGSKWMEAASYLPLICISASAYPLQAINLNMLEVQGRSDIFLVLEIIKKILILGPLFIGAFIGIIPMLLTNIIVTIVAFFLNSHYSGKFIGYNSYNQLRDVLPSFIIAFLVAIPVFLLKYLPLNYWIILPLQILSGLLLIAIICHHYERDEFIEIKNLVCSLFMKSHIK